MDGISWLLGRQDLDDINQNNINQNNVGQNLVGHPDPQPLARV
ncbi:MAG: hypothetical protein QOC83_4567, partial [Pseudonocardiales bacterium]|nr:hypothetical protein [Pseudonocardiales bacterium]